MGEAETHSKVCSVACQDSSPSKEKRSSHSLVVSARSSLRTSHQCRLVKRLTVTVCLEKVGSNGNKSCELPCGHAFDKACLATWLKDHDQCPCCRAKLDTERTQPQQE